MFKQNSKIIFVEAVTWGKNFSGKKWTFTVSPVGSAVSSACGSAVPRKPRTPFPKPPIYAKLLFKAAFRRQNRMLSVLRF